MSNLEGEGASLWVQRLRSPLEAWVKWDCANVVPRVQLVLGVLPPVKQKAGDHDNEDDGAPVDAVFQDPQYNSAARLVSWVVHHALILATEMGNEIFYVTVFPFVFWMVSCKLGIQLVLSWYFNLLAGQWLKDVLCLPRPWHINPTVNPVGGHSYYALEYGFPSTHAISVLSHVAITLIYIENHHPDQLALWTPIVYAALGLLMVSRVYMGVHSTVDLLGAVGLHKVVMWLWLPFNERVQEWAETSTEALYVPFIVAFLVLWFYPRPTKWATSFGDTAIASGVVCGVVVGRNVYGRYHEQLGRCDSALPLATANPDVAWWLKHTIARFVIGVAVVATTYYTVKPIVLNAMVALLPKSDQPPKKRYAVEGPTKFFSYGGIGFMVVTACPMIYRYFEL